MNAWFLVRGFDLSSEVTIATVIELEVPRRGSLDFSQIVKER